MVRDRRPLAGTAIAALSPYGFPTSDGEQHDSFSEMTQVELRSRRDHGGIVAAVC